MASYPTAAITFATRANGQVIDASHVNAVQDEIAAIEAGLLQGTAPLNSSNSTVNALQVAGNCTVAGTLIVGANISANGFGIFGGNLQVSGNSTVTGGLQVSQNCTIVGNAGVGGTLTAAGAQVTGTINIGGAMTVGGLFSPTLADGDTHDLAVASSVFYVRLAGNSSVSTLTGIASAADSPRLLFLSNISGYNIVLAHTAGSVSSNQFGLPGAGNLTLNGGDGILVVYDTTDKFWRTAMS